MKTGSVLSSFTYLVLLSTLGLAGCGNFRDASRHIADTGNRIGRDMRQQRSSSADITTTQAPYLLGKMIERKKGRPAVLREVIHFSSGQQLSLPQLASQVTQISGVPINVSTQVITALEGGQQSQQQVLPGLPGQPSYQLPVLPNLSPNRNKLVINQWSGPLYGLLDMMAARTGTFWVYRHGAIDFVLTETRSFNINILPGTDNVSSTISDSGSSASGASSGATQTSSVSAKLDPYTSIVNNIKTILAESKSASSGGSGGSTVNIPTNVSDDPISGQVTVTATPPELRDVARYVRSLNREMSQNVLIDVHVYSVDTKSGDSYGLNIGATLSHLGHGFTPIQVSGPTQSGIPSGAGSVSGGIVAGSVSAQAVAQALSTTGKVSLVTSGSVIALTGQVTPLQVSHTIYYLKSVSSTNTVNVGSQTSLTPGHYTIGFSGTFLPMVRRGNNILLQYSINLKQDLGIQTETSNGSTLQLPNLATQAFMQRVNIRSGQTLVLSGFQQSNYDQNRTGVGSARFWGLGGGATNAIKRNRLVIVMHVARMQS